jgi:organic radical activating enzyme
MSDPALMSPFRFEKYAMSIDVSSEMLTRDHSGYAWAYISRYFDETTHQRGWRIVDIKPPESGESERNRWDNIPLLNSRDEVKFVLANRADYDWAREAIRRHELIGRCPVLLSPVQGELDPQQLAEWILADRLPVRMQVQMHKILWGNARGK